MEPDKLIRILILQMCKKIFEHQQHFFDPGKTETNGFWWNAEVMTLSELVNKLCTVLTLLKLRICRKIWNYVFLDYFKKVFLPKQWRRKNFDDIETPSILSYLQFPWYWTHLLKIGFVFARGGFYSYYNLPMYQIRWKKRV